MAGLKNGELLRATEDAGFDVFITGDKKITYQQNLAGRKIAIIQLSAQEWPIIKEHLSVILTAIDNAQPGSFQSVDCGTFER
jgi:hypothetical protein